jgi:hypothetical protein
MTFFSSYQGKWESQTLKRSIFQVECLKKSYICRFVISFPGFDIKRNRMSSPTYLCRKDFFSNCLRSSAWTIIRAVLQKYSQRLLWLFAKSVL